MVQWLNVFNGAIHSAIEPLNHWPILHWTINIEKFNVYFHQGYEVVTDVDHPEISWIRLRIENRNYHIICCYRAQEDQTLTAALLAQLTKRINPNSPTNIIICGDFNFPNAEKNIFDKNVENIMFAYGLKQIVDEPTRGDNFLDLIFTNFPDYFTKTETFTSDSDHKLVLTSFSVPNYN